MTRGLCAAVMTAALVACAPSPSAVASARHRPPAAATAGTTHNWVQNAWTTHLLNQSYPANAAYFYDRGGSFGTGPGTSSDPVLDGFATTPVLRYTSFAQFSADLANGVIPNGTWPAGSWVEYDNEQWNPAAFTDAELSDGYGTPAQAFTAGNVLNRTRCAGFFIHVANSDVGWEDTLLGSFKTAGW